MSTFSGKNLNVSKSKTFALIRTQVHTARSQTQWLHFRNLLTEQNSQVQGHSSGPIFSLFRQMDFPQQQESMTLAWIKDRELTNEQERDCECSADWTAMLMGTRQQLHHLATLGHQGGVRRQNGNDGCLPSAPLPTRPHCAAGTEFTQDQPQAHSESHQPRNHN